MSKIIKGPQDYEDALEEVRKFVYGEDAFAWLGRGISTYKSVEPEQQRLHGALLELERRLLVERHYEQRDFVVWKPRGAT